MKRILLNAAIAAASAAAAILVPVYIFPQLTTKEVYFAWCFFVIALAIYSVIEINYIKK